MVDSYGAQLIAMNGRIANGNDRVAFKSLVDLFALNDLYDGRTVMPELDIPPIVHHIPTKVSKEAELCRRVLMLGFESSRDELRNEIEAQNPAIVALYRGFSKFMCQDLESNSYTKHLSKKQRNKLGSRVAFEMLQVRTHTHT